MSRVELNDLAVFAVVAEENSFSKAAARLSMSPSALSHAVKSLETRLGLRLLARTTRSVATTAAGQQLLRTLQPALESITAELSALRDLKAKPAGKLRITTFKYAADTILWPVLPAFLADNPDVELELTVDSGVVDIVADRYDAGIRFGSVVDKDMVAIRVGAPVRAVLVASPSYIAQHGTPTSPEALVAHQCIHFRFQSAGNLFAWPFEKNGQTVKVKPTDTLVFNDNDMMLQAALAGLGIARLYEGLVNGHIKAGRLVPLLPSWQGSGSYLYLFYHTKSNMLPALRQLITVLKAQVNQGVTGTP
jgi:DNA-binding transcriptional LysR family regulator